MRSFFVDVQRFDEHEEENRSRGDRGHPHSHARNDRPSEKRAGKEPETYCRQQHRTREVRIARPLGAFERPAPVGEGEMSAYPAQGACDESHVNELQPHARKRGSWRSGKMQSALPYATAPCISGLAPPCTVIARERLLRPRQSSFIRHPAIWRLCCHSRMSLPAAT